MCELCKRINELEKNVFRECSNTISILCRTIIIVDGLPVVKLETSIERKVVPIVGDIIHLSDVQFMVQKREFDEYQHYDITVIEERNIKKEDYENVLKIFDCRWSKK